MKVGLNLDKATISSMMKYADTSGDGQISREEWMDLLGGSKLTLTRSPSWPTKMPKEWASKAEVELSPGVDSPARHRAASAPMAPPLRGETPAEIAADQKLPDSTEPDLEAGAAVSAAVSA